MWDVALVDHFGKLLDLGKLQVFAWDILVFSFHKAMASQLFILSIWMDFVLLQYPSLQGLITKIMP